MKISLQTVDDPLHNVRFERVPRTIRPVEANVEATWSFSRLMRRARCDDDDTSHKCEKPNKSNALPIILGTAIPICAALIVLVYLHRRHMKKLRQEELNDKTKSMDFGMGYGKSNQQQQQRRPTTLDLEKSKSRRQMSLDLDQIASPYLLPAPIRGSRDSLNSLSRSIVDDRYGMRPGTANSNRGASPYPRSPGHSPYPAAPSMLSMDHRKRDSSIYTASIHDRNEARSPDSSSDSMAGGLLSGAQKMGQSTPPQPRSSSFANSDNIYPPEPAVVKPSPLGQSSPPRLQVNLGDKDTRDSYIDNDGGDLRRSHMHLVSQINVDSSPPRKAAEEPPKDRSPPRAPRIPSWEQQASAPKIEISEPRESLQASPVIQSSPPRNSHQAPVINVRPTSEESRYSNASEKSLGFRFNVEEPKKKEEEQPQKEETEIVQPTPRNPPTQRANRDTLFVPGAIDGRRLSMGARPLPPDGKATDTAEERADRIRSFYKEYFDESNNGQTPQGGYYEEDAFDDEPLPSQAYGQNDYDNGYNNYPQEEYYDDQYVQPIQRPYVEPIQRRAMTPPPRMNHTGRPLPPPRVGSSASGRFQPPPGPRSYSSASGRFGPPRGAKGRPMPPPQALNVLPTPHALKEDAFILPDMFAPPARAQEKAAGATYNPRGGQRPYSPSVRAHTPLASAFDELATLPTPAQLRKSSTFTALDFAPPRKIRDVDNFSDAGSIRSNRSGYSQMTQQSIRAGAYRVSRLPTEVVPLRDDMTAHLKPRMDIGR